MIASQAVRSTNSPAVKRKVESSEDEDVPLAARKKPKKEAAKMKKKKKKRAESDEEEYDEVDEVSDQINRVILEMSMVERKTL